MLAQTIAIISALATVSLADAASAAEGHKTDQGVWIRLGVDGRPTVNVTLGDFSPENRRSLRLFNPEMKLEWTANGQPMPTPLPSPNAQCITIEAQAFSCEALIHWFKGRYASGRPGRNFARIDYPEGFQITNMELDTEYCFRFWIAWPLDPRREWTQWSCATTPSPPPPPPRPFPPSQPVLTLLPAESGAGQIGDGQPWRILVEWQPNASNNGIAEESVLIFGLGEWHPTDGESRPGEKIVALSQEADPGAVYTIRVCARNVSGEACSPLARTPGRPWLEQVPAGGKASRIPVPEPQGSDTYDPDTPRAVPADPIVKAQRRVELPQSSEPLKAQGRVKIDPVPGAPPSALSQLSICEKAKWARDRNSPAAPGLTKQCLASGGTVPQ